MKKLASLLTDLCPPMRNTNIVKATGTLIKFERLPRKLVEVIGVSKPSFCLLRMTNYAVCLCIHFLLVLPCLTSNNKIL